MSRARNRETGALQEDRGLWRASLAVGVVSVLVLIGFFLTSLYRAPEPAWTVVLAVAACGLAAVIALGVHRRRRRCGTRR